MSITVNVDLSHIEELKDGKLVWDQMIERMKSKRFLDTLQLLTAVTIVAPDGEAKHVTLDCYTFVAAVRDALVLQDKEQIGRN